MLPIPDYTDSLVSYKFEHFFDISPDLLCIAGYDGYFKKINPAVSAVLGFSEEELFSRPINDFVFADDRHITSWARKSITQNNPLINFENRYVTKSGDIVWLSWSSMPVDEEQLVFAIAKNITHKKRIEEDRNTLVENLTRINTNLKQLSYTTSHDLRSPVSNLLSVFGLLDVSKIKDTETLEFIGMLKTAAENMHQTLNNYVDILDRKEILHTHVEEIDLQESLEVVLFSINALVRDSNATITTDFSQTRKLIFNKTYLESVYLNLLTNSIKYARPGVPPVVSISSKIINGIKKLIITDNGLGFDAAYIKNKMFGMYQKYHYHPDSKGIGLYLVHSHVTGLGGKLEVESELNKGTTFIISFSKAAKQQLEKSL